MRISDWSSDVCSSDLLSRTFVCRKQTRQLVAEARHARWFQSDDRHAARQIRSQCIKNACELVLRQIEHALGIQRTLTTQLPLRDTDPIAGRFEHAYCSAQGLGMEIVVPGIRPSQTVSGKIGSASCRARVCQ